MTRTGLTSVLLICALLAACDQGVSQESFDAISTGMSQSEVEAILGAGEVQTASGFNISSGGLVGGTGTAVSDEKTYLWREQRKEIVVTFKDGKVVNKSMAGF